MTKPLRRWALLWLLGGCGAAAAAEEPSIWALDAPVARFCENQGLDEWRLPKRRICVDGAPALAKVPAAWQALAAKLMALRSNSSAEDISRALGEPPRRVGRQQTHAVGKRTVASQSVEWFAGGHVSQDAVSRAAQWGGVLVLYMDGLAASALLVGDASWNFKVTYADTRCIANCDAGAEPAQ